ncbi:MAG TPA: ABC transporter ATP-binding protein [Chloroflexota bacterium]|nr:ABC transporter ATP-binding protein [Chloroflexota bacterium]
MAGPAVPAGPLASGAPPLLEVRDLVTEIRGQEGAVRVVDGVSLSVGRGEVVGLVGESGCGKSMTAFSIMDLFPTPAAHVVGGQVWFEGEDLRRAGEGRRRRVRGARIGMVFQDPMSYLDPLMPVGRQIAESLREHGTGRGGAGRGAWSRLAGGKQEVEARVTDLLKTMDLPDPAGIARRYPHELSGGQRQRVLIAAALAMGPALLIADEPTTALDVTVQASILRLLLRLRAEMGLALLLITHDLGIVAEVCDRVYVMYAARVVETNAVEGLFARPRHPYTQGLLRGTLAVEAYAGELFSVPGTVPDLRRPPAGCRFHPRCPLAAGVCREHVPPLMARAEGGSDACWRALEPAAAHTWDGLAAAGDEIELEIEAEEGR